MADSLIPEDLLKRFAALAQEIFNAGHRAGEEKMRDAILQAAGAPISANSGGHYAQQSLPRIRRG